MGECKDYLNFPKARMVTASEQGLSDMKPPQTDIVVEPLVQELEPGAMLQDRYDRVLGKMFKIDTDDHSPFEEGDEWHFRTDRVNRGAFIITVPTARVPKIREALRDILNRTRCKFTERPAADPGQPK